MRVKDNDDNLVFYLFTDHLGSTNVVTDPVGGMVSLNLYKPWGESRTDAGTTLTDYGFTGQRKNSYIKLTWYGSRWYDDYITQFSQPDSIIPDLYNPLDWNRYSYVRNNPINHNDPTGHYIPVTCSLGICPGDVIYSYGGSWGDIPASVICFSLGCQVDAENHTILMGAPNIMIFPDIMAFPGEIPQGESEGETPKILEQKSIPSDSDLPSPEIWKTTENVDNISFPSSKAQQIIDRGWSSDSIKDTVRDPAMTRTTAYNPKVYNKANGNPVTYYYRQDGNYVVIDDVTGQLVQISDTGDPDWIDQMTNQTVQPVSPDQ
jgi:RHS repeat-associated protein